MQLNPTARELILKVAYYGPAFAGKSTNLACLQRWAAPGTATELTYQDMHSERTLTFERLADEYGPVQGLRLRVAYHAVPGQNYYAATRKLVLAGADGIVFVADSRREALDENIAAMNEMLEHLRALGQSEQTPVVLQYNKQDLPTALRPEQLDPLFNVRGWPQHAAIAIQGQGVAECAQDLLNRLVAVALATPLEQLASQPRPRSWLLSCYRCQTMLEVPDAAVGALYTCGACGASLEVVDPDRGITRAPVRGPAAAPASSTPAAGSTPPQSLTPASSTPVPGEHDPVELAAWAPEVGALQPAAPCSMEAGDGTPLPGWEALGILDQSPQGRRWRLRDPGSGRTVRALVLAPALLAEPEYAEQLQAFVDLAGPLKHPHILPLLRLEADGERVAFISPDMPEHEALTAVLARRRVLAPPHAIGILRQIVLALEEAARAGVVHGWLRPDCILVAPDGSVLVDEFAVPKHHRFLVRELAGASAATEYYLAPEHLHDAVVSDLRSDMFLCGALLYRMITGDGLVTGYNAHEALHRVLANGPKALRSVSNAVSRELDAFYQRLVAVDRSMRFASYRELLEALDRFGGGAKRQTLRLTQAVPAPAARPSPVRQQTAAHARRPPTAPNAARPSVERPLPPRRRSSAGPIVAAVLIVGAVVALAGFLFMRQVPNRVAPTAAEPPAAATPPPAAADTGPRQLPPSPLRPSPPPPPPPSEDTVIRLLAAERFRAALDAAELHGLAARAQEARARHAARRAELAAALTGQRDPAVARQLLAPALDGTWGMEGDRAWAEALLAQVEARARPPAAEAAPVAASAPPPATPAAAVPAPTEPAAATAPAVPAAEPAAPSAAEVPAAAPSAPAGPLPLEDIKGVLAALAQHDLGGAQALLARLPEAAVEAKALRLAVSVAERRAVLLDRVAKAKSAKLRLAHPTIRETVDVVAADAQGIETATVTGGRSQLAWSQLPARELGRLLAEAAQAPGAQAADHAVAIAYLVAGGEPAAATLHLRRHRAAFDPAQAGALEVLVAAARQIETLELLARAEEAARSGNAKALAECLVELRKPERAALPAVAEALPRLEAAKGAAEAKPAAASLADRVAFDAPGDLAQFPDSTGAWSVSAGMAHHQRAARLARRDTGGARSVQAILTPLGRRGSAAIVFRGLHLDLDFAAGHFVSRAGARASEPRPLAIAERVPLIVYIAIDRARARATVEINGLIVDDVLFETAEEGFALEVDDAAQLQVDEIVFARGEQDAGRQALRALGWEGEGQVALEQQTLRLAGSAAAPASISAAVAASAIGYDLACRGEGALRVTVAAGKESQALEVRLPAGRQLRLAVRWLGGEFTAADAASGALLAREKLPFKPQTITLTALGPCTISLPIRPIRQ